MCEYISSMLVPERKREWEKEGGREDELHERVLKLTSPFFWLVSSVVPRMRSL